jgi:hypothetical protein
MPPNVQVGAILIEDWPLATQCLGLKSEPYSGKWSLVNTRDSFALDRTIHAAGWNFFFMASEGRRCSLVLLEPRKSRMP